MDVWNNVSILWIPHRILKSNDMDWRIRYYAVNTLNCWYSYVFDSNKLNKLDIQKKALWYTDNQWTFPECKTLDDLEIFIIAINNAKSTFRFIS